MSGRRSSRLVPGTARRPSVLPGQSNRLKGKRRDGLLDKVSSALETQDENQPPAKNVIWDKEVAQLQINKEELEKLHTPDCTVEETPVATSRVFVRKLKPDSELHRHKLKSVSVAKPASPAAELKPVDNSGYAGPRYDAEGRVIHYSILGTFEEYHRESIRQGHRLHVSTARDETHTEDELTVKYEKRRKRGEERARGSDESNALRHWQLRMLERKRQQGYISKLLQKEPKDLTMNLGDNYRRKVEDRYLIDRTIPYKGDGKGYRVGSEFWKQQEHFGDENTVLHMALTQTERGYPPPMTRLGVSNIVRGEKGLQWDPEYHNPSHHPWHQSTYLCQRHKQLQPIIHELCPHKPEFAELQVVGTSKPLGRSVGDDKKSDCMKREDSITTYDTDDDQPLGEEDPFREYPDVKAPPVLGPSLQFAGYTARWTGDSNSLTGQAGITARITFEAETGLRTTSYLEMINDGTTSIFFDWKKLPKDNPFDIMQPEVQRFYFNSNSGVVLPGEALRFPFVFKSGCAGVFTEQWLFKTRPVLCGGADLLLTLKGVALQEDRFLKQRQELERELQTKQSHQAVGTLLDDLLAGVRTPKRSKSPVDAHITEEEIFLRFNPGLQYNHSAVTDMKRTHNELLPEEERNNAVWNLCVLDLTDTVMELDEDDEERKEALLAQLNSVAAGLTIAPVRPLQELLYNTCHKLLSEAVDSIVGQSFSIRHTMGLPVPHITEEDNSAHKETTHSKADTAKDRKLAAAKAGKPAKEALKTKAHGASTTKKGSRPSITPVVEPDIPPASPQSQQKAEVLRKKYREKLYTQAFLILGHKLQQMDLLFQNLLHTSSNNSY